jgi:AAA family ATP:ADP antiporter
MRRRGPTPLIVRQIGSIARPHFRFAPDRLGVESPNLMAPSEPRAGTLDRLLRPFADVKPGEGTSALLLAFNVFLLLTAYYILKPVREALILSEGSAELKSYLSAAMVGVLAIVVPLYGRFAARTPRRRLISLVSAFFAACLVLFYVLARLGVPLGVVYFVWVGIFAVMAPAQFWAFANDLYTKDMGERLFPIIGFGAAAGAVLGALIANWLIQPIGIYELMLVGAVLIVAQAAIAGVADRRSHRAASMIPEAAEPRPSAEPRESAGAFGMVLTTPYLLMIAVIVLCLNWVNTTGEYILGRVVGEAARSAVAAGTAGGLSVGAYIGQFYSRFYAGVNLVELVVQLFLVSRIVKYFGVRVGMLILPCIAFGAYNLLAFYPALGVVRWAKTAENSTDYSLSNTVRKMLYLPCTRYQKYAGMQVSDSFCQRAGDVLSALLVFVGTTYFAMSGKGFARFNLFVVVVWLALAYAIGREYKALTDAHAAPGPSLASASNRMAESQPAPVVG